MEETKDTLVVDAIPDAPSEPQPLSSTFDDQINGLPTGWHADDKVDLWIHHEFHCAFTSEAGPCSFRASPTRQVNAWMNGAKRQIAGLQVVEVWELTPKLDTRGNPTRDSQGRALDPDRRMVHKDIYHVDHAKDVMAGAREAGLHPEMKPLYGYLQSTAEKRRANEKKRLQAEAVTKYFVALLSGEATIEDGVPLGAVTPVDTRGAENYLINTETYEIVGSVPKWYGWCFTEARKSQSASKRFYLSRGTRENAEKLAKSWRARESNPASSAPSASQRPVIRNDATRREENRKLAASRFAALRRTSPAPAPMPSAPPRSRDKKGKGRDASEDRDETSRLTQPALSASKAKAIKDAMSEVEPSSVPAEPTEDTATEETRPEAVARAAAAFDADIDSGSDPSSE